MDSILTACVLAHLTSSVKLACSYPHAPKPGDVLVYWFSASMSCSHSLTLILYGFFLKPSGILVLHMAGTKQGGERSLAWAVHTCMYVSKVFGKIQKQQDIVFLDRCCQPCD